MSFLDEVKDRLKCSTAGEIPDGELIKVMLVTFYALEGRAAATSNGLPLTMLEAVVELEREAKRQ